MILKFNHEKCIVVTTSWTASYKNGSIDIAYMWGADTLSLFDGATSIRRISFVMTMNEFLNRQANGIIDLT